MSTIRILKSALLEQAGFPLHGFTERQGGVSEGPFSTLNLAFDVGDDPAAVTENLARLSSHVRSDRPLIRVRQVHGAEVVDADQLPLPAGGVWSEVCDTEADALLCGARDRVVAVQTADCAAVLVADPKTRLTAAIHAGWRGTAKRVVERAIKALVARGASPTRLLAAIGPRICAKCYEVGEDVARRFPESCDAIPGKRGFHLLDLGSAVEVSLLAAGLRGDRIEVLDARTCCETERFYSHRASGGSCGRGLAFIAG